MIDVLQDSKALQMSGGEGIVSPTVIIHHKYKLNPHKGKAKQSQAVPNNHRTHRLTIFYC